MNNLQITNSQNNNIPVKTATVTNFRGADINTIPQDKAEISSKKKELSTEVKVGIGLGILTIIGVGIYKRKSLKNLWEKIFGKGNKKPPKEPNTPPKPTEAPSQSNHTESPVKPKPENNNSDVKPNNRQNPNNKPPRVQASEQNIPINSNNNEVNFSILTKEGKKYDLKLEKQYGTYQGVYGEATNIKYTVTDKSNNIVGTWNGDVMIDSDGIRYLKGHLIDTRIAGIQHVAGLGTKIKEFIHQEAINHGCKRIEIDAAYGSHIFHNKMGYKSNFDDSENGIIFAKELLTAIKNKNALPEYKTKIELAINSKNISEINKLIDEILKTSSDKKLRSQEIGIFGRMIPMVQYL